MASEEERRSKLLNDYCELRRTHPELPAQLRDFQVKANVAENCTFENQQVDILCSALDETNSSHIMVALPTGYGKSLPMLLLGLLMPKITGIVQSFQNTQNCSHYNPLPAALVHWAMSKCLPLHFFKLNFFVSFTSHFYISPFLYFMSHSSSTASSMWSVETWGVRETKTQVSSSQYCVRPWQLHVPANAMSHIVSEDTIMHLQK